MNSKIKTINRYKTLLFLCIIYSVRDTENTKAPIAVKDCVTISINIPQATIAFLIKLFLQ